MKFLISFTMLAIATPAFAQTAPAPTAGVEAPAGAPAPDAAPVAEAPTATASPATKFSLDTPIEAIVADPAAKAVLDKDVPGLSTHAQFESFKTMSLNKLAPMSNGAISNAVLAKTGKDLASIK